MVKTKVSCHLLDYIVSIFFSRGRLRQTCVVFKMTLRFGRSNISHWEISILEQFTSPHWKNYLRGQLSSKILIESEVLRIAWDVIIIRRTMVVTVR